MDSKALFSLSYGLYVVASTFEGKDAACVVNTLTQVTDSPARLSVTVNKNNFTSEIIEKAGLFTGSVFTQESDMNMVRTFGFRTSRDFDKFEKFAYERDENGLPYLTGHIAARFSCKVTGSLDVGTHVIYVGEIMEAERLSEEEVMTYAYYHKVKNGFTPPNAPSYQKKETAK